MIWEKQSHPAGRVFETPGVNFINVPRTAFTQADPKSVKKIVKLSVFSMFLESACLKAAHKKLMKLTPGVKDNLFSNSLLGQVY
jgi:hypothetical protein